jgi:hypothetical protein
MSAALVQKNQVQLPLSVHADYYMPSNVHSQSRVVEQDVDSKLALFGGGGR